MRTLKVFRGFKRWAGGPNPLLRASFLLLLIAGAAMLPTVVTPRSQIGILRIFAVVVLSFLPGWLFLRFVIVRAQSVWDEYVLNLHRLGMDLPQHLPEPPVNSMYHRIWLDAGGAVYGAQPNLYREKFDAYYGKTTAPDRREAAQPKAETFFPVFLATAVFAAGWTCILQGSFLTRLAGHELEGLPTADMLQVGFLGAYLFTLQMLIRRYFQADLKASAYVNAVVRIVTALSVVLVVDLTAQQGAGGGARVASAFVIGFFPLVGLQALQKTAAVVLRTVVPSLRNDYPLSDLDGLSVWYEARLMELGIEDMENLATANLVDVTLHSRVPVSRLVDWVDQAHLYLHLEPKKGTGQSSRSLLRRLGIRTATALEERRPPLPRRRHRHGPGPGLRRGQRGPPRRPALRPELRRPDRQRHHRPPQDVRERPEPQARPPVEARLVRVPGAGGHAVDRPRDAARRARPGRRRRSRRHQRTLSDEAPGPASSGSARSVVVPACWPGWPPADRQDEDLPESLRLQYLRRPARRLEADHQELWSSWPAPWPRPCRRR